MGPPSGGEVRWWGPACGEELHPPSPGGLLRGAAGRRAFLASPPTLRTSFQPRLTSGSPSRGSRVARISILQPTSWGLRTGVRVSSVGGGEGNTQGGRRGQSGF